MKHLIAVIAAFAVAGAAQAADSKAKQAQAAQKQKVAQCTKQASQRKLSGENRSNYIEVCSRGAGAAGGTQPAGKGAGRDATPNDRNAPNTGS